VSKFEHIYVFGCSYSLDTNQLGEKYDTYSELLADKFGIDRERVYNYSINGSSNFENLYYLNCLNSKLNFLHPNSSKRFQIYGNSLPIQIYDNSLILFQLTFWHRFTLQHTINRKDGSFELIPLSPHRKYDDSDLTDFCEIYYKKLSNEILLQRNTILPIYYTLKGIISEYNNTSTIMYSWQDVNNDIKQYIPSNLINIHQLSTDNEWTHHSKLKNGDLHLTSAGHSHFSEYLMKYITN
jgi:hypothetical protein